MGQPFGLGSPISGFLQLPLVYASDEFGWSVSLVHISGSCFGVLVCARCQVGVKVMVRPYIFT